MKNKALLVSFSAFFALVLTLSIVSATYTRHGSDGFVEIERVSVNGIDLDSARTTVAGYVSDTVPVEIEFEAQDSLEDVRVKVYIEGYKDEVYLSTERFRIVEGSTDVKRFSVRLPDSIDLDDGLSDEVLTLTVRITAKGEDEVEKDYSIRMQKELYSLSFLSAEVPSQVIAGSVIAVDVVLQNNGATRLDNTFVTATIPDLGVEKKIYFGDIENDVDEDDEYINDVMHKKVYLSIPRNAAPGIYDVEVVASNYDTSETITKKIVVGGAETGVLPTVTSKAIATGEDATFEVVLVNPNDRMVVYSITPEESKGLVVTVEEPVITVAKDSSRTVKVRVKATDSAEEGTHIVTVNINSESGLVDQVDLTVNVEDESANNTVLVLTVVLAIIFIVLLIILIVLLTKRPVETEEFGETSYY
ncbi:hypothetical protein GOV14_03315 [Candidatus Pacearchaeota archaeon]|nr:hypothetical protein [Candidatus Pacearchaeota archaeon]